MPDPTYRTATPGRIGNAPLGNMYQSVSGQDKIGQRLGK